MKKDVYSLTQDELIAEINNLSKKSKIEELSSEEKEYRELLRERFIKEFKQGVKQQLKSVKVVNQNGEDITPSKLKELKKEQ